MKIYTDDRLVPYKTTKIDPLTTKAEIDGLLARWGIRKTGWDWNPENNQVSIIFSLPPEFGMTQGVKMEPPRIWTKGNRKRREEINWQVSMRVLYWFLKTNLENAYLMQFDKTTAFLPFILSSDGQTMLKDVIIPRLERISELIALPSKPEMSEEKLRKVIDVGEKQNE
jgi:hypothetical protein